MRTLRLSQADTTRGPLVLVRRDRPLAEHPARAELVPFARWGGTLLLQREAAVALRRLFQAAGCAGEILPVDGYRTRAEQERLFLETERERGRPFAATFVARPGCSEHETGLAVDLAASGPCIDPICPELPREGGVFARFRAKAPYFGFVERYPAGKETVTGIGAEPWHFRYLGALHALVIEGLGLTLEEYIALLQQYPDPARPYLAACGSGEAELCYLEVGERKELALPPGEWFLSGTNTGGVALARWRRYGR